jgi:hypothetical protein
MTESQKLVFETLFKQFGTMLLTKEQMAKVTNISIRTLDRHREKGKGCEYRYEGGRIYYPLDKVAIYLSKCVKTIY